MFAALNVTTTPAGVEFPVKVVPRAARTALVGLLGDALKIAVAAPPHAGQANAAVVQALAEALSLRLAEVQLISGHAQPRKRIRIASLSVDELRRRLTSACQR